MNVRDLAPGALVHLVARATDHVIPGMVEFIALDGDTVIVDNRGFEITIPRGSEFYIADVRTLSEFTFGDEEPDLRGTPPELE